MAELRGYSGQGEVYYNGSNNNRTAQPTGGSSGGTSGAGGKGCLSNYATPYQNALNGANGTSIIRYDTIYTFGGGGGGGSTWTIIPAKSGGLGGGGSGGLGGYPHVTSSNPGTPNTGGGGGGGGCFGSIVGTNYYSTFGTAANRKGGSGTVVLYFDYI